VPSRFQGPVRQSVRQSARRQPARWASIRGPDLVVACGDQVPVDVEGRLDLRAAHELLHGLRVRAGVDQQRGDGVAALMQGDRLEPGRSPPAGERSGRRR